MRDILLFFIALGAVAGGISMSHAYSRSEPNLEPASTTVRATLRGVALHTDSAAQTITMRTYNRYGQGASELFTVRYTEDVLIENETSADLQSLNQKIQTEVINKRVFFHLAPPAPDSELRVITIGIPQQANR